MNHDLKKDKPKITLRTDCGTNIFFNVEITVNCDLFLKPFITVGSIGYIQCSTGIVPIQITVAKKIIKKIVGIEK